MTSAPPRSVAALRALVGVTVIGILGYTYAIGIPLRGASLVDYFGYFTNLTSLLTALVLVSSGVLGLRRRSVPGWFDTARGASVASMLVVALVYNLVVPGTGSAPVWVSVTLHLVLPLLVLIDWVLVPDRAPQPWRRLWVVLPYPVIWLIVVLLRGATDGWVPYGFLLPERGVVALCATVAALLVTLLASAALVWRLSRLRQPGTAVDQPLAQP
nr:Pr6Pr family membrane protein [Microbacterium hydrocarbonoxydans]